MAKKEQVAVRLPTAALEMLDELIGSVYGTNRGDVARSIIVDHLKVLAAKKLVTWRVVKDNEE